MGVKHAFQSGVANSIQSQLSSDAWNVDHKFFDELVLPAFSPTVPAADTVNVFGSDKARIVLSTLGPSGLETAIQASMAGNKVGLWIPAGNTATAPLVLGMETLTAVGTATARNAATTNLATRMLRIGYVSAITAGSFAAVREAQNKYTTGGAGDGLGGFFYRCRFIVSDAAAVANTRQFVGLWGTTTAPTNVEPNTLSNSVGLMKLAGTNNFQFVGHNGTTATASADLGVNFPANTLSTDAYDFIMFSSQLGGVSFYLKNLSNGSVATFSLTAAQVPSNTTLLGHQIWRTNNTDLLAVGLDICSIYIETDN